MNYRFNPYIKNRGNLITGSGQVREPLENGNGFDEDEIKNERPIYGGSIRWVRENAGPITRRVTDAITSLPHYDDLVSYHAELGYHPVVDTRVTMLINENFNPVDLSGEDLEMYQAIPGWHCDGVIRKNREAQPDPETVAESVHHFIFSCSSTHEKGNFFKPIAATGLVDSIMDIEIDDESPIWSQVNANIEKAIEMDTILISKTQDYDIWEFTRPTIHKAFPATRRGFRFFYRLSFYHMPAMNEFRNSCNVYLTNSNKGW